MSEVNLTFVVDQYDTSITVETFDLTFNPNATELSVYTGGYATAAGSSGQVQYNNNGILAGNSKMTFNAVQGRLTVDRLTSNFGVTTTTINCSNVFSNANILANNITSNLTITSNDIVSNTILVNNLANLGSVGNVKISGGTNGQYIRTDGNGNLTFGTPTSVGGSNTQIQYNDNGILNGIPNVTYAGGNLNLGPVSNVRIDGGTNGYFLQTDGTGNLTWSAAGGGGNGSPGGSNTQVQFNDTGVFGGSTNFVYNKNTDTLTVGTINALIGTGNQPNITGLGTLGNLQVANTANVGAIRTDNLLRANGSPWTFPPTAAGANTQLQYNNNGLMGGISTLTFNNSTNLLTMSGNLELTGTPTLYKGKENVYNSATTTGTVNVDVLTNGAVYWLSTNLTGNVVINVRGSSGVNLTDVIDNYETMTVVVVTNIGSTVYYPTSFNIDGTPRTVKWIGGVVPVTSLLTPNSTVVYTFTCTRQLLSNFTVFGSFTEYQ